MEEDAAAVVASEAAAESISRAVMKLAAAVAVGIGDETVELTLSHAQLKAHPHTSGCE